MDTNQKIIDALNSQSPFDDSFISTLHQIGFEDAPKVWIQLLTLRKQTRFPERYPTFFKQFFENLSACFDPDLALNNFLRLTDTFSDKEHFYSLFESNPDHKSYNAMMGEFNLAELELFNYQHGRWHLHQFGIIEEFAPLGV